MRYNYFSRDARKQREYSRAYADFEARYRALRRKHSGGQFFLAHADGRARGDQVSDEALQNAIAREGAGVLPAARACHGSDISNEEFGAVVHRVLGFDMVSKDAL